MMRVAIAVGMILVLIGSAIGQDYQPTNGWTRVDNAAMSSFFGTLLKEAAKQYLKEGAKTYSKYFVSAILGALYGSLKDKKYCYFLRIEDQGLQAVLIPEARSRTHCQQLARICGAGDKPWSVQYSNELDFPYTTICHEK